MITAIRRFAPYLRPYRLALLLGALASGLEVLIGLAQPWPLRMIVDDALAPGVDPGTASATIITATALLVALVVTGSLMDYWSTRLLSASGLHIGNDARGDLFAHLQHLSLRYHGTHAVGDLTARVTADVDRVQDMLVNALARLLPNALMLVGMFVVMLVIDPVLTLVALAVSPLMFASVRRSARELKLAARRARKAEGEVASTATEGLASIHLVQAFTLEERQRARFALATDQSMMEGLEAVRLQARFSPTVDTTSIVSYASVLLVGAYRVIGGRMTLGLLLVFLSYVSTLYKPVKALSKLAATMSKGVASAERVSDVLDAPRELRDVAGAVPAPPLSGAVTLRRVTFSYDRGPVLHDISLDIAAGETIALVGATGAGKSTLVSLIARMADPDSGIVALDGVDVRCYTVASVREQVSIVLQDSVLMRGTIRENIALGRADATRGEVERAARLALVDEFSDDLRDGLDTVVGERASDLSGGQRQRIAIARAILRKAPILILDEPTSALDAHSEELISTALGNLPRECTQVIIAHRLSTVRRADRIVVLDHGRIVEVGTPDELLRSGGRYAALWELQLGTSREPVAVPVEAESLEAAEGAWLDRIVEVP